MTGHLVGQRVSAFKEIFYVIKSIKVMSQHKVHKVHMAQNTFTLYFSNSLIAIFEISCIHLYFLHNSKACKPVSFTFI